MASDDRRRRPRQHWGKALFGIVVLIVGGFLLGLIVGVVSEEPELVVGHVTGRSTEIAWGPGDEVVQPETVARPAEPAEEPEKVASAPAPDEALPSVSAKPPAPVAETADAYEEAFLIQVGAFADGKSAEGVASSLRAKGYPVSVLAPSSDERWRVRVGPVSSRPEAESMAGRLKSEERLPTWVLRDPAS
jgi:cell division protein FtsN